MHATISYILFINLMAKICFMFLFFSSVKINSSIKVEFKSNQTTINGESYKCQTNAWKFIVLKVSIVFFKYYIFSGLVYSFLIFTFLCLFGTRYSFGISMIHVSPFVFSLNVLKNIYKVIIWCLNIKWISFFLAYFVGFFF